MEGEKKVGVDFRTLGTPPLVQADRHETIYVNSSRAGLSPWDIRFSLGQVIERAPNISVNQDLITVIMAPSHAKAFMNQVIKTVQAYEETFGPINDPTPSLLAAQSAKEAISLAQATKTPAPRGKNAPVARERKAPVPRGEKVVAKKVTTGKRKPAG